MTTSPLMRPSMAIAAGASEVGSGASQTRPWCWAGRRSRGGRPAAAPGHGLEAGLDHVVRIVADHRRRARPRPANPPASGRSAAPVRSACRPPGRAPNCPSNTTYGAARQVDRDLRAGLVHGQQEPVAADAALVAERAAAVLRRGRARSPRPCGARRCAGRRGSASSSAKPPCLPSCSSMWSKKPMPVATRTGPLASRSTRTVMSVSLVLRVHDGARARATRGRSLPRSPTGHRAPHTQAAHAEVGRQCHVGVAVADHRAGREVHPALAGSRRATRSWACGSRSRRRADAGRRTRRRRRCPGSRTHPS